MPLPIILNKTLMKGAKPALKFSSVALQYHKKIYFKITNFSSP